MVEVYADLLFLINAGMDGLCLSLVAGLCHRRVVRWRWLLSAAVGGAYAVLALFLPVGAGVALVLDAAVCLLMCALAFGGPGAWRQLPCTAALYTALSMVLGGVMTALYHLLNRLGAAEWLPRTEEGPEGWLFLLLALAGGGVVRLGGRAFRRSSGVRACTVVAELGGRRLELVGLLDSGNLLREPLSGRAVICISWEALRPLLSPELWAALQPGGGGMAAVTDPALARRLRAIPARTATGEGLLVGLMPDRVTLRPVEDPPRQRARGRGGEREVAVLLAAVESVHADALPQARALVPGELL